jgi:hypothetical protein
VKGERRRTRTLGDLLMELPSRLAEAGRSEERLRREELELARLRDRERQEQEASFQRLLSGVESRRVRYEAACRHLLSLSPPIDPTDERVAEYLGLNERTIRRWRVELGHVRKTS